VPADCLVVLDEAYREYVRDSAVPDGISLYRDRPNVAVLRTFSKAYGLAGLRVGFLVAAEPVAGAVRKTMLAFSVNALAQAAAIASLEAESELLDRVGEVVKERGRVRDELLAQGWTVPPTEANFVWLPLGEDTVDFATGCEAAGIAVRPFAADGARISIGDHAANEAMLAVTAAYPRRHRRQPRLDCVRSRFSGPRSLGRCRPGARVITSLTLVQGPGEAGCGGCRG
jgi:histidinol-phosphate aminotransferase